VTVTTARRAIVRDSLAMPAVVVSTTQLNPHMVRVRLHCDEIEKFDYAGPDHLVRVFLPPRPGAELHLPIGARWWPEVCAMPEAVRPVVRNYTVRAIDRITGELDIDFVLHGDEGPASSWARRAVPGDKIGILSDGARFEPPATTRRLLLVGDETALPAISATLEQLHPEIEALVLLEVDDVDWELELFCPPNAEIRWLHRAPTAAPRGLRVLNELRSATVQPQDCYAWVAGESSLATSVRRHLVNERGFGKDQVYFCGYWRQPEITPR